MTTSFRKVETTQGADVIARAHARFVRSSPRKVRLVADQIRYQTVGVALDMLKFMHKPSAAPHVLKVLLSAVKNAEETHPEPMKLRVAEITVDPGPMLKRLLPAPMGRAFRIRRRMCHINVYLSE